MSSLLRSLFSSATTRPSAAQRARVCNILQTADGANGNPFISSWPATRLIDDAERTRISNTLWSTWHFADSMRAILVQLAPTKSSYVVDMYLVVADAQRVYQVNPRGCVLFERRNRNDQVSYPTVILDGLLTVRPSTSTQGAQLVYVARSSLWSSRSYEGRRLQNDQRATNAHALIESFNEDEKILVYRSLVDARPPLDIVYGPLQTPAQKASVELGKLPFQLRSLVTDGIEYWPNDGSHHVGADPSAFYFIGSVSRVVS